MVRIQAVAALAALVLMGCATHPVQDQGAFERYRIVRVRGCEYVQDVYFDGPMRGGGVPLIHAGDCGNHKEDR